MGTQSALESSKLCTNPSCWSRCSRLFCSCSTCRWYHPSGRSKHVLSPGKLKRFCELTLFIFSRFVVMAAEGIDVGCRQACTCWRLVKLSRKNASIMFCYREMLSRRCESCSPLWVAVAASLVNFQFSDHRHSGPQRYRKRRT